MTPILKWLIIQCIVKDTLKKMQKIIREHEGPWAVTGQGFVSCATGFLGHLWHDAHSSEPSCCSENQPCFAMFQSTGGRIPTQTPEHTSGSTKNNKTTKNIFSELPYAPDTEDASTARAAEHNLAAEVSAEQTFAVAFSTRQSNPQWLVASAQKSEATFPDSLKRAVAKPKHNPKLPVPVQYPRYQDTCWTQCQRAGRTASTGRTLAGNRSSIKQQKFNISLSHRSP